MAKKTLKWKDGGNLYTDYTGSGNGTAAISSDINQGCDRSTVISVATTKGGTVSRSIRVNQPGLRTPLVCSDGVFTLNSGGTFNVLKK